MSSGFLELNLSLNLKLSNRPSSLINIQKDISEIDKFYVQVMTFNDHLLNCRQQLSRIHRFQNQIPHPMLTLSDAIETLEDEITKMKQKSRMEYNERFVMDFSMARKRGFEVMETQNYPNYGTGPYNRGFIDHYSYPLYQFHEKNQTLDLLKNEKRATMELEKGAVIEVGEGSGDRQLTDIPLSYDFNEPIPKPAKEKRFRRNWTQQLHLKFLQAIEFLGGAQVAKPRLIKQIMNVEGLTNDQVKSHLQMHRRQLKTLAAMEEEEDSDSESVGECGGASQFYFNGFNYQPFKSVPKPQLHSDTDPSFSSNAK